MATLAERMAGASGEDDPKKKKPAPGTPVVTVGAPVSVGTPKSELDRLANAPDLATRISTRLALLRQPAGYVTEGRESAPDQIASAVGHMATEAVRAPLASFADAVLSPSIGDARPNPALSKGGNSAGLTREMLDMPYDAEHGAITPERRTQAGLQTLANVVAPAVGAVPGGALVGASYDPEHPVRGAVIGATIGAATRLPALADRIQGVRAGTLRMPGSVPDVTPASALGINPSKPLSAPSNAAEAVRAQVDAAAQFERGQQPLAAPARRPLARSPEDASLAAMEAAHDPRVDPILQERAASSANALLPDAPPVSPLSRRGPQLVRDNEMARNMAETGFASAGMTPDAVVLPASGAGRAGTTTSAVAAARAKIGPERLRALADAELARRGGPATPEAQMAAMEQVARNVASDIDVAMAGGERYSGLPISTNLRERITQATRSAITTPYANIEHQAPNLAHTLMQGGAATKTAEHITERRMRWVREGLTPEQEGEFGRRLVLDNMDTEAVRKQAEADAIIAEHKAMPADELRAKIEDEIGRRAHGAEMLRYSQSARYPRMQEVTDLRARLGKATKPKQLEALADELFAAPSVEAAQNWRTHAEKLRPSVTPNVEREPWFQATLGKYKQHIETPLQSAALAGGVDRASLREPSLAYVKLATTKQLDDAEIRRALDVAGVKDLSELERRPKLLRKLIGENPVLREYFARNAEGPRYGPLQENAGAPTGGVRGPRSQKVGSAKRATGKGEEYATDLGRILKTDATEKIRKGRNNDVLRAVTAAGRRLEAGEAPRPGYRVLGFDDKAGVVGDNGVNRIEVTPEVHEAVNRYHAGMQPPSTSGRALRGVSDIATRLQISGMPVEATSHAGTEVSIVAKVPGEKSLVNRAIALNPIPLPWLVKGDGKFFGGYSPVIGNGAKIAAAREMNNLNFAHPDTRALESRLADIGALRIEEPHGGLINSAHHWLFGPEGVDTRARIVLAQRYLKRNPKATDAALREFVNGKVGNYIPQNAADLPNFLARGSILSPFARFQTARIPTSIKTTLGESGLPAKNGLQKAGDVAQTLYRGPLGLALGAAAGTYLATGKRQSENEPGHALDIRTGFYATPGKIQRLSDDEATQMGDAAKPLYIPAGVIDPVAYAGLRATGLRAALFAPDVPKQNAFAEAMRDVANVGLGMAGPGVRLAQTAATGTVPYIQRDGTMMRVAPRRFNKNAEVAARFGKAGSLANPALHALSATSGDAGLSLGAALAEDGKAFGGAASFAARAAEFTFPRFLSPTIGGRTNEQSVENQTLRDYDDTMTEYKRAVKRAPGPIEARKIIEEAMADAESAGFDPSEVEDKLTKALDVDADVAAEKKQRTTERRLDKVRP